MKKGLILLLLLTRFLFSSAQNQVPEADLLDLRFLPTEVKDYSKKDFQVEKKGNVSVVYDPNAKQYVARFKQNSQLTDYFKIDYKNDADFKNKLQTAFTIEVYIKAENNKTMSPVSSMESGGFGIQQVTGSNPQTKFFIGKSSGGYSEVGKDVLYGNIKSDYHHIVYTYDGNNLKSYCDGVNTGTTANVGKLKLSSSASAQWLAIGGDVAGTTMQRRFVGDIAYVKMYSTVLSESDIKNAYEKILGRQELGSGDTGFDRLNVVLTETLKNHPDQESVKEHEQKGWELMSSLETEAWDIQNYFLTLGYQLGIQFPEMSDFPRFAVMSDIHVGRIGWDKRLPRAVEVLNQKNLDAIFVVGDVADNGRVSQLEKAVNTYSIVNPKTAVYYSMGNHDWWEGNRDVFQSVIGQRLNQFIDIKGYPFIMVSLDGDEKEYNTKVYQNTSKNFLKAALDKATKEYPGKPVFVFMHVPLTYTVYGANPEVVAKDANGIAEDRGYNTTAMKDIVKQYSQAIVFTGHSHYALADERSIEQKYFTAVHDGNLTATNVEKNLLNLNTSRNFDQSLNITEGLIVSVDNQTNVTVDRIDMKRDELMKKPWVIRAPHDGSMFTYFRERDGGELPYFEEGAELVINNIKNNSFKISFPQAKDDDMVHHYSVELINKSGAVEQYVTTLSDFFLGSDTPDSLSIVFGNLKGIYSDYTVRVTPYDSFYEKQKKQGRKATPLVGSLKDIKFNSDIYLTGSATPNGWTNTNPEVMTKLDDGIYSWTGQLKRGEFKFLLQKNLWDASINPTATRNVESGTSYNLNITNSLNSDYKFNIAKAMFATILIDTKNWTVEVIEDKDKIPLYLVGEATPTGWSNTVVTEMEKVSAGVYTWTGYMKKGHFKFITEIGTWNSIVPTRAEHENIIPEFKHIISDNYQGDYRFNMVDAGNYTIYVDLNKNTMYVDKVEGDSDIYLVGEATPNGWNNTKATPMQKESPGVYVWSGSMNKGNFKFITKLGTWNSIVPSVAKNEDVILEYSHTISNVYRGDYRFNLLDAGTYTIRIDMNEKTMSVFKAGSHTDIYIVGAATSVGWNNKTAMPLINVGPRMYEWRGTLKKGEFKFITKLGTWNSLVPVPLAHESIKIGSAHKLTNDVRADYKFVMNEANEYIVTLDLESKTFTVDYALGTRNLLANDAPQYTVISDNSSITINSNVTLESVRLWDINGRLITTKNNESGSVRIDNLNKGIYVLELTYNGEKVTRKVLVD